jgi:hypothetical protein
MRVTNVIARAGNIHGGLRGSGLGVPSGARTLSQPSGWAVLGPLPQLVWIQSMPSPPRVKSFPHNSSRSPVRIVESGAGTLLSRRVVAGREDVIDRDMVGAPVLIRQKREMRVRQLGPFMQMTGREGRAFGHSAGEKGAGVRPG